MPGPDETPLNTESAAMFLNVSEHVMRIWRQRKTGPAYTAIRLGMRRSIYRYRPADLRAFLEAHTIYPSRPYKTHPGPTRINNNKLPIGQQNR